jgi:hypothetical protein
MESNSPLTTGRIHRQPPPPAEAVPLQQVGSLPLDQRRTLGPFGRVYHGGGGMGMDQKGRACPAPRILLVEGYRRRFSTRLSLLVAERGPHSFDPGSLRMAGASCGQPVEKYSLGYRSQGIRAACESRGVIGREGDKGVVAEWRLVKGVDCLFCLRYLDTRMRRLRMGSCRFL